MSLNVGAMLVGSLVVATLYPVYMGLTGYNPYK
jgi:hypothetical protein